MAAELHMRPSSAVPANHGARCASIRPLTCPPVPAPGPVDATLSRRMKRAAWAGGVGHVSGTPSESSSALNLSFTWIMEAATRRCRLEMPVGPSYAAERLRVEVEGETAFR